MSCEDRSARVPLELGRVIKRSFPRSRLVSVAAVRGDDPVTRSHACTSGRVIEIDFRAQAPDEKLAGDLLFALLVDCAAALGLDHVIWDRRIWVARERGGPRPFAGADAHGGRLRIAFSREGSERADLGAFRLRIVELTARLEELELDRKRLA